MSAIPVVKRRDTNENKPETHKCISTGETKEIMPQNQSRKAKNQLSKYPLTFTGALRHFGCSHKINKFKQTFFVK